MVTYFRSFSYFSTNPPAMPLLFHNTGAAAAASISLLLPNSSSFPASPSLSFSVIPIHQSRRSAHIALARRGLASRTRRLEKRGKDREETEEEVLVKEKEEMGASSTELGGEGGGEMVYSTGPPPALPGLEQDFWEGTQWDALGFFVQYMWAFGIVFGVIACGIAVATYNEGATDFKQTTVYKESIQSRELLEQPEDSNADVFEGNPTEVAPSLE
ncbi:hypothetical protein KFK09_013554 [Dendrobium nobile]|uniref:Uncharacterized protein n=1 Tax=Dendrobium nobile TaxID=94219 RepID=A0A8T3BDD0_DENNO|nr:hypothetical protein KFK09_013554 [Dendrobium nobile]